jgi:hypothetical protein
MTRNGEIKDTVEVQCLNLRNFTNIRLETGTKKKHWPVSTADKNVNFEL